MRAHVPDTRAALRAGIEAAEALSRGRNSILAVGLGFKHSRVGGYGKRPIPCLTFTVVRKTKHPARTERIPRILRYSHEGVAYRIRTDVRSVRPGVRHEAPKCRLLSPLDSSFGSAGFLLTNAAGDAWLVTAGHVLLRGSAPPNSHDVVGVGFAPTYAPTGRVLAPLTHFPLKPPHAAMVDIGVALLTTPLTAATRTVLDRPPWSGMTAVVSVDEIIDAHLKAKKPYYTLYGATSGDVAARFAVANFSTYATDVEENGVVVNNVYAAITLISETTSTGRFRGGDSGGPLIDEQGRLFGIHILGLGGSEVTTTGLAILASSIIDLLRDRLGDPSIRLARPAEIQ